MTALALHDTVTAFDLVGSPEEGVLEDVRSSDLPRFDLLDATAPSVPLYLSDPYSPETARILLFGEVPDTSYGDDLSDGILTYLKAYAFPSVDDVVDTAASVRALRERLDLTWSELAELFGVSRRAVHNWANGAAMNSRNQQWLAELFDLIVKPGETPDAARRRLMQATAAQPSLFRAVVRERESRRGEEHLTGAERFAGSDPGLAHEHAEGVERDPGLRRRLPDDG